MPRHDRNTTPPEKRRAPKGSTVGECRFRHTKESAVDAERLRQEWGLSEAATIRKALSLAAYHARRQS